MTYTQHNTEASAGRHGGTLIQSLFSPGTAAAQSSPALEESPLFDDEVGYIASAVPKRRAEFSAVRACARRALSELGIEPAPLVPLPDRSPRWPDGIVGSMTHTTDYCAAVVAKTSRLRALGLDAERERTLEPDLLQMICTARERSALAQRQNGVSDAIVYFSAKEAFYKCQYSLTLMFLDFLDVELDVDFDRNTYRARVIKRIVGKPEWLDSTSGRFLRNNGLILCGSELRLPPER